MGSMFQCPRRKTVLFLVLSLLGIFALTRINVTPYCPTSTTGFSESSFRSFSKFLPINLKESSSNNTSKLYPVTILELASQTHLKSTHVSSAAESPSESLPQSAPESSAAKNPSESLPQSAPESSPAKSPSESLPQSAPESSAAKSPSKSLPQSAPESSAAKSPSESLPQSAPESSAAKSPSESLPKTLLSISTNASKFHTEEKCSLVRNLSKPHYSIIENEMQDLEKTYFRLNDQKVNDIPQNFSITGSNICDPKFSTILFVGPSVVDSETNKGRLEIRKTWASRFYADNWLQTSKTRLVFFFGSLGLNNDQLQTLKNEAGIFKDIVVGDFQDSYGNLSLKMTVIISWVAKYCPNVEAMVKVDMDTFVNVELLLGLLQELPSKTYPNYVLGKQHRISNPPVVRSGRWAVPKSIYRFKNFPTYVLGHSYVVSGSAVKLLAKSFPYFPIIPNEDAFVTGIMPVVLNITRFGSSFADKFTTNRFEDFKKNILVSVILRRKSREQIWNLIKDQICDPRN